MFTTEAITALISLTFMEIVLGIDNIVFIAILTNRLPESQRTKGRNLGISFALVTRLMLLFSISWIMSMTEPILTLFGDGFSVRDFILIGGGLFLIGKSTREIHDEMEGIEEEEEEDLIKESASKANRRLGFVVLQIMVIDIIFSLDSVITAVGMAQHIEIMVTAMLLSMIVMLFASKTIAYFVKTQPTVKILALAFLILVGVFLTLEGTHVHVNKNYIYIAMFFAFMVEMINMRYRKKRTKTKKT
jgi:predicted tellurium resistance membrane protein TerC